MIDFDDWYFENIVVAGRPERPGPAWLHGERWRATAASVDATGAAGLALRQGFVLTHRQARSGLTSQDVRRLVRRDEWCAPWRGVVAVLPSEPYGRTLEVRSAAAALVRPGTAMSHESSGLTHGLPLVGADLRHVDAAQLQPSLTGPRVRDTCARENLRVYAAALDPDEIVAWFGAPTTSVARTVIDLARERGRFAGLAAADAALHEDLVTSAELTAAAERAAGWPGVRAAREILGLACPEVESPLESLARLFCRDHSIPLPEPQVWVRAQGRHYRVDGLWAERAVVLELDGMAKYADKTGKLGEERRRQEDLERAGYLVVRVSWAEIRDEPLATVARIRWALRTGGRRAYGSR